MSTDQDQNRAPNVVYSDFYEAPVEYRPANGPLDLRGAPGNDSTIGAYFWNRLVWTDQQRNLGLMDDLRDRLKGARPKEEDNGRSFPEHGKALYAWMEAHRLWRPNSPLSSFDTAAWCFVFDGCPKPTSEPPTLDRCATQTHFGPRTLAFIPPVHFEHAPWDAFRDTWEDYHREASTAFKAYLRNYQQEVFRLAVEKGYEKKKPAGNLADDIDWLIEFMFIKGKAGERRTHQDIANDQPTRPEFKTIAAGINRAAKRLGIPRPRGSRGPAPRA